MLFIPRGFRVYTKSERRTEPEHKRVQVGLSITINSTCLPTQRVRRTP